MPLALVVALSPFSVIPPLLLVLHAARPRATGVAFAIGWLLGLGASTAVFLGLPGVFGDTGAEPGTVASYARIGIGVALVVAGVVRWLTRRRAARRPAWLDGLTRIRPPLALALGVVLPVLNPKFLFANAAAGFVVGTAGLPALGTWCAVAGYTLLAGSTAVGPVVVYAAAPRRFDGSLARIKDWIERRHAELTAVILIAIGIVLLAQRIGAR